MLLIYTICCQFSTAGELAQTDLMDSSLDHAVISSHESATRYNCNFKTNGGDLVGSKPTEVQPVKVGELDELEEFVKAIHMKNPNEIVIPKQMLHCPKCGDVRRMRVWVRFRMDVYTAPPPLLATLSCVQCDAGFTALLYDGPGTKPRLVILPSTNGGLTTPHTPEGVAYYLDQAQKAHSIGANSASVAMFRGALEHLLFEQGFKTGMCGKKLTDLEAAIESKTAPNWAYELDTEFLTVMKKLGDGSIHPNDGDIKKQEVLDSQLIAKVSHTFQMLLFLIYEVPLKKAERLDALKAAVIKK
jgi:hypothetical protein